MSTTRRSGVTSSSASSVRTTRCSVRAWRGTRHECATPMLKFSSPAVSKSMSSRRCVTGKMPMRVKNPPQSLGNKAIPDRCVAQEPYRSDLRRSSSRSPRAACPATLGPPETRVTRRTLHCRQPNDRSNHCLNATRTTGPSPDAHQYPSSYLPSGCTSPVMEGLRTLG